MIIAVRSVTVFEFTLGSIEACITGAGASFLQRARWAAMSAAVPSFSTQLQLTRATNETFKTAAGAIWSVATEIAMTAAILSGTQLELTLLTHKAIVTCAFTVVRLPSRWYTMEATIAGIASL
jgi:hypothetical protein